MLFRPPGGANVRLLRCNPDGGVPTEALNHIMQELLMQGHLQRVAIMVDDDTIEALRDLDPQWLDSEEEYQWSGWLVQKKARKPPKRIIAGTYCDWFLWFMRFQRFRAFHSLVLIKPFDAVLAKGIGGYIEGLLARLMVKERQFVVVTGPSSVNLPPGDAQRTSKIIRALLYGTRQSTNELYLQSRFAFTRILPEAINEALRGMNLHLTESRTRYQLDAYNTELLEHVVPGYTFKRKRRFRREATIPDRMLESRIIQDVERMGWATIPIEKDSLSAWLRELNEQGDRRLTRIYESMEDGSDEQWDALLGPTSYQIRRVLDELVANHKLERTIWYKEVGKPALAYRIAGKVPFLNQRCGQCAFYAHAKRRCNLWWLVNKRRPFFERTWKDNVEVTDFDIHKMKFASRMGPHSSACKRFIDKKRDHLRNSIPERCEICEAPIPKLSARSIECQTCRTRYVKLSGGKIRVMTAYEHDYTRLYHEITGGEATADLEAWRVKVRKDLLDRQKMLGLIDEFDDILTEPKTFLHQASRPLSSFSPQLQASVDELAKSTDIARQLSMAMALSARNATQAALEFGKVYSGDAAPITTHQERYLALLSKASPREFLPYEALIMKEYWLAFGFALRGVQEWFGPRKRSRYVAEFVEDPNGRARGYSPLDAAINYLHQRRLGRAQQINGEVGFPGVSDGFLHKKLHNSRGNGLIFDMIDPFKFADREVLLSLVLDRGLTWKDFKIETDRRGSNFYYPMASGVSKLDSVGIDADHLQVEYLNRTMELNEAYSLFAESLLETLTDRNREAFKPFTFLYPIQS